MSTKSTIHEGPGVHLYKEFLDETNVYLQMDRPEFNASPRSVTIQIPIAIWNALHNQADCPAGTCQHCNSAYLLGRADERRALDIADRSGRDTGSADGVITILLKDGRTAACLVVGREAEEGGRGFIEHARENGIQMNHGESVPPEFITSMIYARLGEHIEQNRAAAAK